MGVVAEAAYSLGVAMGLASYQASVGQNDLAANALDNGQPAADLLNTEGLITSVVLTTFNQSELLVTQRAQFDDLLRNHSVDFANAYSLGLRVALAEGQCTSSDWEHAVVLAHQSIEIAGDFLDPLSQRTDLLRVAALQRDAAFSATISPPPPSQSDALSLVQALRVTIPLVLRIADPPL
jgi:hypothetical protein